MRIETYRNGLRLLAPAKLNLYLEVGPLRPDKYHDIDSIFQSITLYDEIILEPAASGEIELEEEGIAEREKNLVYRACIALRDCGLTRRPGATGVRVRLRKTIPHGAGLGGGSSDAAATLVGLSRLWGLNPAPGQLEALALKLGSDVPFFLVGGTARCTGQGERIEDWNDPFDRAPPLHYVLAFPRTPVATRDAYGALDRSRGPDFALTAPSPLDSIPPDSIRNRLGLGELYFNRFESVVFSLYPEVGRVHSILSREDFLSVRMSGSGSTIFGVSRSAEEAERLARKLSPVLGAEIRTARSERPWEGAPPP